MEDTQKKAKKRVRWSSPVDEMPDAIGEKKSRVLEDMDACSRSAA